MTEGVKVGPRGVEKGGRRFWPVSAAEERKRYNRKNTGTRPHPPSRDRKRDFAIRGRKKKKLKGGEKRCRTGT